MKSKSNYEKRLEYNNTYNRNNYRSFSMRLHNENEADLIEWIESQDSVKEYLLSLVRKDIEKSKKKEKKKRNHLKIRCYACMLHTQSSIKQNKKNVYEFYLS